MQKIFDVDNKEDMDLLWSILPDFITSIYCKKESVTSITNWVQRDDGVAYPLNFISICWHDKTEITRPVNYEDMIGCVGWFWDNNVEYPVKKEDKLLGILGKSEENSNFFYDIFSGFGYDNFTPAKKSELKFYGEDK